MGCGGARGATQVLLIEIILDCRTRVLRGTEGESVCAQRETDDSNLHGGGGCTASS